MTRVAMLTASEDELEVAAITLDLALTGMTAAPAPARRPALESFARKLTLELERRGEPSIEQLQAALEVLHQAGLITLAGDGVPANLAQGIVTLKAAVEFYADHEQYGAIAIGEAHTAGCAPGDPRILIDRGARARRALRLEGTNQ
jgi:hypothetical protein